MTRDDVLKLESQTIPLTWFNHDERFQLRVENNGDAIERYRQRYLEMNVDAMPPVVAVEMPVENPTLSSRMNKDGEAVELFLVDGFHRFMAARRAEMREINAIVLTGENCSDGETIEQLAVSLAMEFNFQHGAPYTQADRRNAVRKFLKMFPDESYRTIAQKTGVSKSTVENIKKSMEPKAPKKEKASDLPKQENKTLLEVTRDENILTCAFCGAVGDKEYILSDPDPDWRIGENGRWYCSDDCEELAKQEELEKQADEILKEVEKPTVTFIDEPPDPEPPKKPELDAPVPCKVCGSYPEIFRNGEGQFWAQCTNCRDTNEFYVCTKYFTTVKDAIEAWNRGMN